jgi:site-specific recombinase XerD
MAELIRTGDEKELVISNQADHLVEVWRCYLEQERYAMATRAAYGKAMKLFLEWLYENALELQQVTPVVVRAWRNELLDKSEYAPATVSLWMSGVRGFYAWLIEQGAPITNPAEPVRSNRKRGSDRSHKRDRLSDEEIAAVFRVIPGDTEIGARDRAIIGLMFFCALRTIEVHRANIEDLDERGGRRLIWVQGKGSIEPDRFVVLPADAERLLNDWLSRRGNKPGPLFWGVGNRSAGKRLSLQHLRRLVTGYYKDAGVAGGRKSTHSLRHAGISNAIQHGASPLQVKAMAGHATFDTTLLYYHEESRITDPAEDFVEADIDFEVSIAE